MKTDGVPLGRRESRSALCPVDSDIRKQAETYKRFHYYTIWWAIPSAVVIPFLAQAMTQDPYSKWLITLISSHTAILLSLHKGLKVERNYKGFRKGESEFCDAFDLMYDATKRGLEHKFEWLIARNFITMWKISHFGEPEPFTDF